MRKAVSTIKASAKLSSIQQGHRVLIAANHSCLQQAEMLLHYYMMHAARSVDEANNTKFQGVCRSSHMR